MGNELLWTLMIFTSLVSLVLMWVVGNAVWQRYADARKAAKQSKRPDYAGTRNAVLRSAGMQ